MRLRSLLQTAPALAGFLTLLAGAPAGGPAPIRERLEGLVRAFPGTLGIAAKNLETGESFAINGDKRFPTASLIKIAVMVETYHQIAEGKFRAETAVTLAESDKAGDEPVVLNQLHPGISLTVSDLLALMIAFSDNTATNLLVHRVGAANVDRRMVAYGLPNTKIFRPTFRDGHADVFPEEEREFGLGMTTPNEIARLMELIAQGKVVSRAACDEMLALMEKQQDRAMIPRSLRSSARRSSSPTRRAGTRRSCPVPRASGATSAPTQLSSRARRRATSSPFARGPSETRVPARTTPRS